MTALIDSLAAQFAAMPEARREALGLGAARRAALTALTSAGLPGSRSERWKYTPLRALAARRFVASSAPAIDADVRAQVLALPAPRLVFVNGGFDAALSDFADLPDGVDLRPLSQALAGDDPRAVNVLARVFERDDEPFARANAALADEGVLLRLAAGVVVTTPVHLVYVGVAETAEVASHRRVLIELREAASLTVVEHTLAAAAHRNLSTAVCHVHLKPEARLTHVRLQRECAGSAAFARTDAALAAGANYRVLNLELGGGLARHELNVSLQGKDAAVQADGVLLGDGKAHVDTRLGIDHAARDTRSSLTWRGLGRGAARIAFHGGIGIREGADGSEAMLSNKNLLLSELAEIDTQPVLEIHADEVKAAHGATVGRLDPTALFYLRSRGLPAAEARGLLTEAFCMALLSGVGDEALNTLLRSAVQDALRGEVA